MPHFCQRNGWKLGRVTIALLSLTLSIRAADTVSIAGAANLIYVLKDLSTEFQRVLPGTTVTTTTGASGTLYAQIKNGAPFDVFLSADVEYPKRIAEENWGVAESLTVFATGRLVAWTLRTDLDLADLPAVIRSRDVRRIAIAQPRTAPYGRAAQAALERMSLWSDAQRKLVVGESISQTAQFVETSNAEVGFVALSIVLSPLLSSKGRWVEIPAERYAPVSLDHAAVLTRRGGANPAAKRFLVFLSSEPARKILRNSGYHVK